MVVNSSQGAGPGVAPGVSGINPNTPASNSNSNSGGTSVPSAFGELLNTKLGQSPASTKASETKFDGLRFSQHALERMTNRGITIRPEDLVRLNQAVEKAAAKGSKESLILMGDNALIVSVKNRTVVTAMDRDTIKENVFTNIDSTVIL